MSESGTNAAQAGAPRGWRTLLTGHGRPLGAALLTIILAGSFLPAAPALTQMRMALFDVYQKMAPRLRTAAPSVIVAIDEKSLSELGQWPWPRTVLAQLIEAIAQNGAAAIGVDILMPEPDRMSPENIAGLIAKLDAPLAQRLARLPSNDEVLADTMRARVVALGIAGTERPQPRGSISRSPPFRIRGNDPAPRLRQFSGALRSLDQLDAAARGHGLLSVDPSGGVVRRVPLVAAVDGVLTPALSMEVLRLATRTPAFVAVGGRDGLKALGIGDVYIPTNADGTVWVHFGPHDEDRFVSAVDVLSQQFDTGLMRGKIALIGATAAGLLDYQNVPTGERLPGIEIHAQILEAIFEHSLLQRPAFLDNIERLLLAVCALVLIATVPAVKPRTSALLYAGLVGSLFLAGFALYRWQLLLLDVAWPAAACTLLFGVMLTGTLAESERQRRTLRLALEAEREAAARAAGELEAARRIQMGMLPPPSADFYRDRRFTLHTLIEPAKSVGGDLYDFFKLDADRLFFMIGDVAGKGLPASIFMAVSKALYKGAALRMEHGADIGEVMRAANEEIARDNPEMLFVTVFAGILDLRTGELAWCNAGHDAPFILHSHGGAPDRLEGRSGPPLCVVKAYGYGAEHRRLAPGQTLCLFTDGVTEAMNAANQLYGRKRLAALLASLPAGSSTLQTVDAIRTDVHAFVADTERSDDLTILALSWKGPQP